eukprot:14786991-Ditylum_brightwellii.AAC.1
MRTVLSQVLLLKKEISSERDALRAFVISAFPLFKSQGGEALCKKRKESCKLFAWIEFFVLTNMDSNFENDQRSVDV